MRTFFESFAVAFSMYSRIPMPQVEWNKKNMRYSMLFFPAVGVVIAAILYGVFLLFRHLSFSPAFFASAAVFVSVLVTGGIHMDGYCDTCDAIASHGDRETRLRIMKDPHIGAFGAIYTFVILLIQFGALQQLFLKPKFLVTALACFVLSRSLAALAVIRFPKAKDSGLAATFSGYASKTASTVALIIIAAFTALLSAACSRISLVVFAIVLLFFWIFYRISKKRFDGITGDLAGFFITVCETMVLVLSAFLGAVL